MGTEPVNESAPTPGCTASAAPGSPKPWTTWSSAAGMPAVTSASTNASAQSGVCSDGFSTIPLPASSAGKHFHDGMATGKFHGVIIPTTPTGCRVVHAILSDSSEATTLPSAARPWPATNATHVDRLLHVAACLDEHLAGLAATSSASSALRSAMTSAAPGDEVGPCGDRAAGPLALRLARCADRVVDVGSGCRGERAQHLRRTGRVDRIERRHHLIVSR